MIKKIGIIAVGIITLFFFIGWQRGMVKQWKNWAGNQRCTVTMVTPHTIQELISCIDQAKKEGKTIRAYGSGHSWNDIVCTDYYLINTDKLHKVIAVDLGKKQVTVQGGIKLKHLNKELAKIGLCLSNQPAITEQSLAGVVSTATHGSGKTGTMASFVTKVQLLTADGKLITISETENRDLFGAVRTSLGSLGIMTEITVQCEPLFKLHQENRTSNWNTIIKEYKQLLANNDYMQFYWNASDDSVDIILYNRVPNTTKKASLTTKIKELLPFRKTDYSYKMLSDDLLVTYMEEEIALPIDRFIEAAQAAQELVRKEYQKNPLFSDILFRFVRAEKNNYLSPAANQDVVFFSITTPSIRNYEQFYQKFYHLMLNYGGRPHWAKINYLTKETAQQLYGTNFEQFIRVRKKLDPQGLFSNSFTKRIFGW